MANDDAVVVMEEREELMVSPGGCGGGVCRRTAHFLRPSVTSTDDAVAASSAAPPAAKYEDLPFRVSYRGWKIRPKNWKTWVDQMHSLHHSTWKRAGILDAITASTCTIHRYKDLILELVEKWCPTTNSFAFPWGEATITLEDVMVLGGYSVLGESVLIRPAGRETEEMVQKLLSARSDILRGKLRRADQSIWIAQFMGSGSEIEHEAFLAYWLSKFVFPFTCDTVRKSVMSIAAHLARGTRIALAPAVLACIYKSLTLLKAALIAARKCGRDEGRNVVLEVTVPAPFALVQVWIWERFPSLRPEPEPVGENEPRLARWHNLKLGVECRSRTIDSAGKDFQWRPYTDAGTIYMDRERWVMVESDLDEDLEGYVRCLRTSELVSLEANCIEHYLPHRVAMQFGMDQDLPGHVARVNVNPEIAWSHYTRPIRDAKVYVPPRLSEPRVTTRYWKWWKELINPGANGGSRYEDSELKRDLFGKKSEDDFFTPPPGFSLKWKRVQKAVASGIVRRGSSKSSKRRRKSVENSFRERSDCNDSNPPTRSRVKASHLSTGIGKRAAKLTSRESYENNQSQGDGQGKNHSGNVQEVGPVESRTSGLEDRIRNIEKLLAMLEAGKISLP